MNQEKILKILAIIIIFSSIFTPVLKSRAEDGNSGIDLQVIGGAGCNSNGVCESGENETSCPSDCGCNSNGVCEINRGENSTNCPIDCPAPPSQSGGALFIPDIIPPVIYNLLISKITLNSADVSWNTNEQGVCQLLLGKNQEYETMVFFEDIFHLNHSTTLNNLSPATDYHFEISCKDTNQNESETPDQKFTTLTLPDITPPANVSNLEAIPGDSQIELRWRNPKDSDFKAIKIIRSTNFYPTDPLSGLLVYEGNKGSFLDTGLTNETRYYYTVFAYDYSRNYSSGAVVSATPSKEIIIPTPPPPSPPPAPPSVPIPPEVGKLNLNDFNFNQGGENLNISESGLVEVSTDSPMTVSIDYEKVPEVLKTIIVTVEQGQKTFSFLLRVNSEKTKYEAKILPPEPGIYPLTIAVLNYKDQSLKTVEGQIEVKSPEIPAPIKPVPWYKKGLSYIYILLVLLVLIIIFYFIKKRFSEKSKFEKEKLEELGVMNP